VWHCGKEGVRMSGKLDELDGGISNRMYCNRLVELAFPDKVRIEPFSYTESELRAALIQDEEMLNRLVEITFPKGEMPESEQEKRAWKISKVLEKAFPSVFVFDGISYTKDTLNPALLKNPKLQQYLASMRYYMPSKWLVEQEWIARENKGWEGDIYTAVANKGLTGVCFSGGGIRSATFNLGVLQGLAQLGMLPYIDYLSSVSGGGYIHEFLAGWILRNGNQKSVVRELIPQSEPGCLPRAPEPIQWLKRYASYLTPVRGIFSTDTWTMLAIWFRNTVLNQIPILASFGAGLFVVHLLVPVPTDWGSKTKTVLGSAAPLWWQGTGLVALVFALTSLVKLWKNLDLQECKAASEDVDPAKKLLTNSGVVGWIILPWLACAVWMTYWVGVRPGAGTWRFYAPLAIVAALMLALAEIVIFKGGAMGAWQALNLSPEESEDAFTRRREELQQKRAEGQTAYESAMEQLEAKEREPARRRGRARILFFAAGVLATAVACGVGWWFVWACGEFVPWLVAKIGSVGDAAKEAQQILKFSVSGEVSNLHASLKGTLQSGGAAMDGVPVDPWRIQITLLPMFLLSVPYVAIELTLGLLGRDYRDMRREWLARLRAWSLLYALLWAGVVGLTLLGPYVGIWVATFGPTGKWTAAIGFVVAHLTTVLGGASGKADGKPTDNGILGYKPMDLLALVAAPFAMVSFLLLLSYAATRGVDSVFAANWGWTRDAFWRADLICTGAAAAVAILMGWRVDINEFSMHTFYKNRLSRCYLGAVVPGRREPDPFTGFDGRGSIIDHDMKHNLPPFLTELLPKTYVRNKDPKERGKYDGPFPIFCTTLNLTTGDDLATQERKGTSFAFTPLYSGYSVGWTDGDRDAHVSFNGYVPTDSYAYPRSKDMTQGGIHVDSAVAISGAAANPNMGYNTNPALAFLMTLFNVRLGWWICNPRRMDKWNAKTTRATPTFALRHLFLELFGAVGDDAEYINLSDGGHFENMGLYELVRRRCKYIVVCDAENDPQMAFGGMGMAITKCRADFGAEIDLDLRPLRIDPTTGYSKAHCVVGTIQYPPPWAAVQGKAAVRTDCVCLNNEDEENKGRKGPDEDLYSGLIVYMKSSLVGDEPADLLTYQLKSPVFPQDSTANQWFTESQFEAYRRLGHHVAMATMKPALPSTATKIEHPSQVPELFTQMNAIWYPRTPEMEEYLGDHLKQYEAILKELRERKELEDLEAALNSPAPGSGVVDWTATEPAYAIQFANSLLDFMCTVYTNLQLAFPDNRTSPHAIWWICMFRRWCRVDVVQESWKRHADVYPEEFKLFAKRELMLP
jgi:hypothetical protein